MAITVLSVIAIVFLVALVRRGNEIDRLRMELTDRDRLFEARRRILDGASRELENLREDNARLSAAYQSEAAIVRRIRDLMNDTKGVE